MSEKVYKQALFFSLVLFIFGTTGLFSGGLQGYRYKEDFHKTFPLERDGIFSLTNINGTETIETWNRDEVDIRAEKAVRGSRENLDKIKIDIESGSGRLSVNTIFPKIRNFRAGVTYEIKVPEGIELEKIRSVNGDVRISGPVVDIRATTTNGNISISRASGRLFFSTTNGNVVTEYIEGEVDARSTNGRIHLEMKSLSDDISARTTNGGISLVIEAKDIDADVEASTTNGRVTIDYPVTIQSGRISSRRLSGRIGSGGPLISLRTTNGPVKILN